MVKLSSVKEFRFEFVNKLGLSSKAELRQLHLNDVIHYALFTTTLTSGLRIGNVNHHALSLSKIFFNFIPRPLCMSDRVT